ncbi:MAG: GAF domain-containing protein [Pseudomonadota bacterium]
MSETAQQYDVLLQQATALFDGERHFVANCANLCALLFMTLEDVNWAGVYLMDGDELIVGPFQGLPACTRIGMGKGVCGTAAQSRQIQRVDNVHEFDGHIACDSASNSEIVLPIVRGDTLLGVLDIDSPIYARFSQHDEAGLSRIVDVLVASSDSAGARS